MARRKPIPRLADFTLPFLPLAFKFAAISFRHVADGYYAADNSGWQVKYSGDAFLWEAGEKLLTDGDIARRWRDSKGRGRVFSSVLDIGNS